MPTDSTSCLAKPDEHGKVKGRASTKGYGATDKEYKAHLAGSGSKSGASPLVVYERLLVRSYRYRHQRRASAQGEDRAAREARPRSGASASSLPE
jgi:hypothetical protein